MAIPMVIIGTAIGDIIQVITTVMCGMTLGTIPTLLATTLVGTQVIITVIILTLVQVNRAGVEEVLRRIPITELRLEPLRAAMYNPA